MTGVRLSEAERYLLAQEPRPVSKREVVAARRTYRRAYAPWGRVEEFLLLRLTVGGLSEAEVGKVVQRQPQAVEARLKKLAREFGTVSEAAARLSRALALPLGGPEEPAPPGAQTCPYCTASVPAGKSACPSCGSPVRTGSAPAAPAGAHHLPVGTTLQGGKYSLGRVLGEGGFGITYGGANVGLRQRVAVKELFPPGATRQGRSLVAPRGGPADGLAAERAKFVAEARTLARFTHGSVVRVLDAFEENGTAYMVMEFLAGETLRDKVTREGPLAPALVTRIARDLLGALAAVHAAKVLHRDIKPENVMLVGDRTVLIDFGAAREFASGRTQNHSVVLTPGFAPLEQYARAARRGPYTDLYALAATLYYALSGAEPAGAIDRMHGAELAPLPKSVASRAPALAAAVTAALALKVEERPQSAADMLRLIGPKAAQPAAPARSAPAQPPAAARQAPAAASAPPKPQRSQPPTPQPGQTPDQFIDKLLRWLRNNF